MHNRKRTGVPETENDRLKRLSKVDKWNSLTSKALEIHNSEGVSEDIMTLSSKILSINPEYYTMWNSRRRHLYNITEDQALIELQLTKAALMKNPKSYVAWFHREWVVKHGKSDLSMELELCNLFLSRDSRNFHCWNYRRFIVREASISDLDEFKYTTKLINDNFSNYSAWHYRSTLLLRLDGYQSMLDKEFDLVQSAFYTEPDDQSAWLYHRWLLSQATGLFSNVLNLHIVEEDETTENSTGLLVMQRELQVCLDLLDIEPDCKWALLTSAAIVLALDRCGADVTQAKQNLPQLFQHILVLDPLRTNYYNHILSQLGSTN